MRILVLDGGGMQGAFMAGVLNGFYKKGIKPDFFDHYGESDFRRN